MHIQIAKILRNNIEKKIENIEYTEYTKKDLGNIKETVIAEPSRITSRRPTRRWTLNTGPAGTTSAGSFLFDM
jgi:hypothetical protein